MAEIEEDFSDINLDVESDDPGQRPEHEWVNEYGTSANSLVQVQEVDATFEEMTAMESVADELDLVEIDVLDQEVRATEEDVPYSYMYWLHQPGEFVDDTPDAPPESGDVDPDTGELVP